MIASSSWKQGTIFEGLAENGNRVVFDSDAAHAGGPSPMEAVLMALCACTSVDVVSVLRKKREPVTSLVVSATAEQAAEAPRVFTHIRLTYRVGGEVSPLAVEYAVQLSKDKYCSVSKMLEKSAKIEFAIDMQGEHED